MQSPRPTTPAWHSAAWLGWAIAAGATVQLAPSPVYVGLIVGIAWLMVEVHAPEGPFRRAFPVLVLIGVMFAVIRVAIAALTTHNGIDVLVTLPHFTMPQLLGGFAVGGTVESTVVAQALAQGLTIIGMMAVFGAFNAIASHYELVQSSPRAFHELGVVTTVALAFVPSTIESAAAVREADRARTGGRPVRRGRAIRMLVPVLERGMERAVSLSESMDARGFGGGAVTKADQAAGWCGLASLLLLGGAFVALIGRATPMAIALGLGGVVLLGSAIRLASAAAGRPRYRHRRMTGADWAMVALAFLAPLAIGALGLAGNSSLIWRGSPLTWPTFEPVVVLALLPLLAPLLRLPPSSSTRDRDHDGAGEHVEPTAELIP